MSQVCQLTGKKAMVGHKVSFSNKKYKRLFNPNLVNKRFYLANEDRWIDLKISTSALRTVNKIGIEKALQVAREKGFYAK